MNYEEVLRSLNGCGTFQVVMLFLLGFTAMQPMFDLQMVLFMHYTPQFTCNDPEFNNSTKYTKLDECVAVNSNLSNDSIFCTKWIFDPTVMRRTLVTDYDLVCSRSYLTTLNEMLVFGGITVGYIFGSLGDSYGRKKMILIGMIWEVISSLLSPLVDNLYVIMIIRFLRGFCQFTHYQALELMCELVPVEKRGIFGINFWTFGPLAYMGSAGLAIIFRDWRQMRLVACIPQIFYILFFFLVPESPRWLSSKGRQEEAVQVLKNIAKWNNRKLKIEKFEIDEEENEEKISTDKPLMLFQLPNMRKKTLSFWFILTTVTVGYYGVSVDNKFASDNLFLNVFLMGLIEVPTGVVPWLLSAKFGRRMPQWVGFILSGIAIIIAPFLRQYLSSAQWIFTTVAIMGKFILTATFCLADLYIAEIFPTTLRNAGFFSAVICAQTMSMIAPYINRLQDVVFYGSGLVFGILCFISAFLTWYYLPETIHCPLPQTIDEAEELIHGNEDEWSEKFYRKSSKNDNKNELLLNDDTKI